jgi:protein-disulfide isomerase/uncharacterized membrane protein
LAQNVASIRQGEVTPVRSAARVGGAGGAAVAVPLERYIPRIPWWAWVLGLVFIAGAIVAVGALVLKHFTNVELPGCHAGSACDGLENHMLGRILLPPGVATAVKFGKWPVSFLGLSYYVAVGCAWVVAWRRIAPGLRWMIRLGALVSVVYMIVIVIAEKYCKYCMASHALNFALLATMEVGLMMAKRSGSHVTTPATANAPSRRSGLLSLAAFAIAFAGATSYLGAMEHRVGMAAEAKLEESQQQMLDKVKQDTAKAAAAASAKTTDDTYDFGPKGFTGRYRLGPEATQVRIVMFGAYTCQFCRQMEGIGLNLVEQNPGKVSLCFKHFPMNSLCNPHSEKGKDPEEHRNACWASRCAEACAIWAGANAALAGEDQWAAANDAFWKAHKWLFSIGGNFTDDSLMAGLKQLGFDADKVTELMTKPSANAPVLKDIEEGHAIGLFQTPMIFVNGVELKGWQQPGALERAVQTLLAANAPAMNATNDKPDLARVKAVADWRDEMVRPIAAEKSPRVLGKPNSPVQVIVFGDYQEENTQKVDKMLRAWLTGPGGLAKSDAEAKAFQYTFKHFPGDKSCNAKLYKTFFEFGCMTAKAAEAAGLVGGEEGFWKMHNWLINNPKPMGLDAIKKGARAVGLDGDAVVASMNQAAVTAAIGEDVDAGHTIAVAQIPAIYINGKFVKTWSREGDDVLGRIIDEAAAGKK